MPQSSTTDTAKEQATNVAGSAQDKAKDVANEAQDHARRLVVDARSRARDQAEDQTARASEAARDASRQLSDMADGADQDSYLTSLTRDGANRLDRIATRLDEGGLDGAIEEVRRFGRQRPGAFIAVAFGAGLLAGRVLRNADTTALKDAADPRQEGTGGGSSGGDGRSGQPSMPPPAGGTTPAPGTMGAPTQTEPAYEMPARGTVTP